MHTQAQEVSADIATISHEVHAARHHLDEHVRDALILAVAKVAVNESGWRMPADTALIWQTTQARGRTHRERLEWLTRHSSCVLTDRPLDEQEQRGNCGWTRNLRDDDSEPEGWSADVPWSHYVRHWWRVRTFTRLLVTGQRRMRPCAQDPLTWGSRRIDMAQALARGLRPLGCRDPRTGEYTLNDGFVRAGDERGKLSLLADIAVR